MPIKGEKQASSEIAQSREPEKSIKVLLVELAVQTRLNLGQMKAVGDFVILAEARAERDTRERIAQILEAEAERLYATGLGSQNDIAESLENMAERIRGKE